MIEACESRCGLRLLGHLFKAVILSETGSTRSALPVESKNPMPAALGSSLDGNSLNSLGRTPSGTLLEFAARDPLRLRSGQAFDCMSASPGEADTPLKMTAYDDASFSTPGCTRIL